MFALFEPRLILFACLSPAQFLPPCLVAGGSVVMRRLHSSLLPFSGEAHERACPDILA